MAKKDDKQPKKDDSWIKRNIPAKPKPVTPPKGNRPPAGKCPYGICERPANHDGPCRPVGEVTR